MTADDIRKKFLAFFHARGHAIIPSASLIPENDPTVLFTTAGMHPLVPYLLGEAHPEGRRLVDVQKCIRTGDINEVGDNRHLTFFEMLGNWSLGDYFKNDAIAWSFQFLTQAQEGIGLDPQRLYVTVFEGDVDAPRDDQSIGLWQAQFRTVGIDARLGERIFSYPKKKNWWGPAGETGPCGPDTEMFYDTLGLADVRTHASGWADNAPCNPNCDCGRFVEIWNDVFMEYFKNAEAKFVPLAQKNVDTGMGLERVAMILQHVPTVFDTELFAPLFRHLESISQKKYHDTPDIMRAMRIIADHVRTATFIVGDPRGVSPSNVDQGYVLRRLLRRAVRYGKQIGIEKEFLSALADVVITHYSATYPELREKRAHILQEMSAEAEKFSKALDNGLKELDKLQRVGEVAIILQGQEPKKINKVDAKKAFYIYQTFGFPLEMIQEELAKKGLLVDEKEFTQEFDAEFKKHQDLSRAGAEQKFAGGLADHSERVVRMHTATHLLHKALHIVLGDHVEQRGSNITSERLRFDFSHPQKMTPEEITQVEAIVNEQISKDLPVHFEMVTVDEAKAAGAIGLFEDKYAQLGNKVKIYIVGDDSKGYFSKEICGGPHVEHTAQVGTFRILKEEASSSGIRRIKAVVE